MKHVSSVFLGSDDDTIPRQDVLVQQEVETLDDTVHTRCSPQPFSTITVPIQTHSLIHLVAACPVMHERTKTLYLSASGKVI